jgi:hypothetical protein
MSNLVELEITWGRIIRVWWAFAWRNLILIFVSMLIGGIFGTVAGFVGALLGFSLEAIQMVVVPISFLIGVAISVVPFKLLLGKDFKGFKLVLIQTTRSV